MRFATVYFSLFFLFLCFWCVSWRFVLCVDGVIENCVGGNLERQVVGKRQEYEVWKKEKLKRANEVGLIDR